MIRGRIAGRPPKLKTANRAKTCMQLEQPAQPRSSSASTDTAAVETLKVLVTASETYPELERAFLTAEETVLAGFRMFDLDTRLRAPEACEIGETWADLFVHTLDRGVAINLTVADFDPIAAPELHRIAWGTQRQIDEVRTRATAPERLTFKVAMHDARVGLLHKLLFYPVVRYREARLARQWLNMSKDEKALFRQETPGLQERCYETEDGRLCFSVRLADLHPATHHQKIAVFDRKVAFIGGLDLNERRYDTKAHDRPADETWHDIQVRVTGGVARDVQRHLESFTDVVAGKADPPQVSPAFLRTLSRSAAAIGRLSPVNLVNEIEERHHHEIARARKLIYLETQYLRHQPLAKALARRARACPELKLIVVLPAAPEELAFSHTRGLDARFGLFLKLRCLRHLRSAFGNDRLLVASPVQARASDGNGPDTMCRSPLIYVHSKVSIFDENAAIVSSANLNGRSFRWDTETGVALTRPEDVAEVRKCVMGHWAPDGAGVEYLDIDTCFERWKALINDNSTCPPEQRNGFLVRHDTDAAREIAVPAPGVPDEMV